jgi:hypothetical protein
MFYNRSKRWIDEEKKKSAVRPDLLWKALLESFLYSALEIFYPELYAAIDLDEPPVPVYRELQFPGLRSADRKEKILALLMDLPLKSGEYLRILLYVETEGLGTKEPLHVQIHNYACAITLIQKRPFTVLAIRTTHQKQSEKLTYEMDRFGTRHTFSFPTVFIDQLDEQLLLAKKENPVALAIVCVLWMKKAKREERKRYLNAHALLKIMKSAEYSVDTNIELMQFIEGMANLNMPMLKNALQKDLEQDITEMFGEEKSMNTVQAPILRKILRKKAQETLRAEGKAAEKIESARRMLSRGVEIDIIADITELTHDEIHHLQNAK